MLRDGPPYPFRKRGEVPLHSVLRILHKQTTVKSAVLLPFYKVSVTITDNTVQICSGIVHLYRFHPCFRSYFLRPTTPPGGSGTVILREALSRSVESDRTQLDPTGLKLVRARHFPSRILELLFTSVPDTKTISPRSRSVTASVHLTDPAVPR